MQTSVIQIACASTACPKIISISSSTINRFSKFFHWHTPWTIWKKVVIKYFARVHPQWSRSLQLRERFGLPLSWLSSTLHVSQNIIIIIIIITLFTQRKQRNENSELDSRAGQHGSKKPHW